MEARIGQQTKVCIGKENYIDGILLPDGDIRISKSVASMTLGHSKCYLGRILADEAERTLRLLKSHEFSGKIEKIAIRPNTTAKIYFCETISLSDFRILINIEASLGNTRAISLLTKTLIEDKKTKRVSKECLLKLNLAKQLNGSQVEVSTPAGNIDILTDSEVIEVKHWKKWKEGIGQVLCYGKYFPDHTKRIHFFGNASDRFKEIVLSHCVDFQIVVTEENSQNELD